MTDLENPIPKGGTEAANPSQEPANTQGTVQPDSQATGGKAPVEGDQSFTKIDPKTLPPQLRESYNNMLRDYKEKTTQISERVKTEAEKAAEAYKQKAELYDQLAGQEEFVKKWNEYVEQANQLQVGQESNLELAKMKQDLQRIQQSIQMSELSEVTKAFAEAENEKGEKLRPDFEKLNEIEIGSLQTPEGKETYSILRASVELSPGKTPQEKLANGYAQAKKLYDTIYEEGRKAGLERVQRKVLNGSQPPSQGSGDITLTEKRPKNAREALELARKGIAVSR